MCLVIDGFCAYVLVLSINIIEFATCLIFLSYICRVHHLDPVTGDEPVPSSSEPDEANVWVFAFGSNMDKNVLEGRRMIKPAESVPAIIPGMKLTFNQPGLPYREPGFGTLEPIVDEKTEIPAHGVAHRMTEEQWEYYKETEGAAGQSDVGYGTLEAIVEAYDGRKIKAVTLITSPKTLSLLKGKQALPSQRYINILRKGAKEHNLHPEYQEFLSSVTHWEPSSIGGRIGRLFMGIIAFGLLFPFFFVTRLYRKLNGMKKMDPGSLYSKFQAAYFNFVFKLSWALHDILSPILGCGCTVDLSYKVQ